jgi:AcrR family transcriptional regulator
VARVVKEHIVRRNEILDAAQRLVQTRGYEQMAIQEILDELRIAKDTFYHYFGSKQALLEAVVERILEQAEQITLPIVRDPHLPASEKLQRIFDTVGRWKSARIPFFMELLRIWYTDDNAIVRTKLTALGIQRVTPLLTEVVHQGVAEGSFRTDFPEQVGSIVMSLVGQLSDTLAGLLLAGEPAPGGLAHARNLVAAYSDAVERVLGAQPGSLTIVDSVTLEEWFRDTGDSAHKGDAAAVDTALRDSAGHSEHSAI